MDKTRLDKLKKNLQNVIEKVYNCRKLSPHPTIQPFKNCKHIRGWKQDLERIIEFPDNQSDFKRAQLPYSLYLILKLFWKRYSLFAKSVDDRYQLNHVRNMFSLITELKSVSNLDNQFC